MTAEKIKAMIEQAYSVEDGETMEAVSQALSEIKDEVIELFTQHYREGSPSWHALASSGMKEGQQPIPADAERKIALVITDLLHRKLKPHLR